MKKFFYNFWPIDLISPRYFLYVTRECEHLRSMAPGIPYGKTRTHEWVAPAHLFCLCVPHDVSSYMPPSISGPATVVDSCLTSTRLNYASSMAYLAFSLFPSSRPGSATIRQCCTMSLHSCLTGSSLWSEWSSILQVGTNFIRSLPRISPVQHRGLVSELMEMERSWQPQATRLSYAESYEYSW